ncbi:MAG: alkaline phosphatase family protein [Myxococcales bacterium]|nr:alkaline phosphatase family protein [Myxococcales bacterium]
MKRSIPMGTLVATALFVAFQVYMALRPPQTAEAVVPGEPADATDATMDEADEGPETAVVAELSEPAPKAASTPAGRPRSGRALADLVVLISVDGLRPDVIAGNARQIQRMHNQGSHAAKARTISKASTLPSHASMVSGVDIERHGLGFNSYRPERGHIQYPTIFTAAQEAGLTTALFVGKRKLEHLLSPESKSHFEVGGVYCNRVTRLAVPYIESADPGVVFVHFSDPDGAGHRYGWMSPQYMEAVRRADRCVAELIAAVETRDALERTLVLLTSDHGGHDHNHGSRLQSDREIPWILWGGPAQPQRRIGRTIYNTDTAATILHALGLTLPPDIEGKAIVAGLRQD